MFMLLCHAMAIFSRVLVGSAFLGLMLDVGAHSQSLNPKAPTQLVAGENRATVDSMIGPQYWSFKYGVGKASLLIHFTSMPLFGNPMTATIQVVLHSGDGKLFGTRSITSTGKGVDVDWPANFTSPGSVIVEIRPPGNTLVRSGGDYTIAATGPAVELAGIKAAGPEQIVGTYSVMGCPPDFDCQSSLAARFNADGTVTTTGGHKGKWTVFDPNALIYSVVVGQDKWSLKLFPGRGLFNTSDLSVVVFQAVQ